MKMIEPTLALYEQRIKGLEDCLAGRTQVWQLFHNWFPCRHINAPSWPSNYSLVCALDTSDLVEAMRWTNDQCHWERQNIVLFAPFGWDVLPGTNQRTVFRMPRSTSVGDVLVTPEGVAYVVDDFGFSQMACCSFPARRHRQA